MSKDLGKSTSYAYYVAEGGTKTPQEYGEMLVNIDTVATRAEDAADSAAESATGALNSKNAAQTAATTATNKATEATTAATTATTKAGEASTSASTATSAKDTAVSAASTATTKATEATTAAATATSAKTDAVAANTAAQSAKTAAQTAQTGAETAAASVEASAEQIATNAADISQLKSDLSENTINLCDVRKFAKGSVTVTDGEVVGTASAFHSAFNSSGVPLGITFDANTQYTISFYAKNDTGGTGGGLTFGFRYSDNTQSVGAINNSQTSYGKAKATSTAGKTVTQIFFSYNSQGAFVWHLKDVQVEKGTTSTEFIPFISATDYILRENFGDAEKNILLMNSKNVFKRAYSKTTNNITCALNGDGYATLNGSHTSDVYFDIATSLEETGVEAGKEYWLNYGAPSTRLSRITIYFDNGSGYALGYDNLVGVNKIKIPNIAVGILIRLWTKANVVYNNTKYKFAVSEAKSNHDLAEKYAEIRFAEIFGTGDCTFIKFNDGKVLVIDFGFAEAQHTFHRSWKRIVADLGVTHIDYAVISHYHEDHIGLLIDEDTTATDYIDITDYIDGNTTFFLPNGHAFTQEELDALAWVDQMANNHIVSDYNKVMAVLDNAGCKIVYPTENEKWLIGGGNIQFWNADQEWIMDKFIAHETYDYNEASMCCYVTIGSQRVCFSGDIGEQAMERFKTSVLSSSVYKANHHAVGYGIVPIYLNSLMPKTVVTSIGYNLARAMLGSSALQAWCESNNVSNVVTGINQKFLSLKVTESNYVWTTSCRRLICADEGITS